MIPAGTRIGRYEVQALLGAGGFGMVYAARDVKLERACAIKFLLPEHTSRPEILQRFLREARSAKIKHPGVVTVFECEVVEGAGPGLDGMAYIAMELLEGETLAARMARGAVPLDEVVEIARQVADAVGAAHAVDIIHRDLKPANIFLVPDRATRLGLRIKVLDFGIAKLAGDGATDASLKTHTLMIFGSPPYMSPEQCRSTAKVDARSDIYALGCILFEMVCGRPPFTGDTGELIGLHQHVAPPAPRTLRADVPAPIEALVVAMLAKDPAARPQTMQAVIEQLGARPPSSERPVVPDDKKSVERTLPLPDRGNGPVSVPRAAAQRRWWPLAAASAVVAVAGTVAIVASRRDGGGECPAGMVWVPGGQMQLGALADDPSRGWLAQAGPGRLRDIVVEDHTVARTVTLGGYCIDRTEVTVDDYIGCIEKGSCIQPEFGGACNGLDRRNHPINCVDWKQARMFCGWVGKRLPTDAEWERAARGADHRRYPWGDAPPAADLLDACGDECKKHDERLGRGGGSGMFRGDDGFETTAPVGSYPGGASPYGALDLAGNVAEWVDGTGGNVVGQQPSVPVEAWQSVRGGAWSSENARDVDAGFARVIPPDLLLPDVGFRCAK